MLATVLICVCGGGCAPQRVEEATDTVTLPGGAVLTNTTYVTLEDHRIRHNELSYQEHASAGTETIAHLMDLYAGPPLSLRNPEPRIYQTGDRTTIGLDRYALQRWMMKDGPYWYRVETNPDQVASVFLRSFMKAGDVVADTPRRTESGAYEVSGAAAEYVFDRYDPNGNALITRRKSAAGVFPDYLVYSATQYGFPWRFALELTRTAAGLQPPSSPGFGMDVSVVIHPGGLQASIGRSQALALPGAREICAIAVRVNWSEWSTGVCSAPIESGVSTMRFGLQAGFRDPLPEYAMILWRYEHALWAGTYFVRTGEWVRTEAADYGQFSRLVFMRTGT